MSTTTVKTPAIAAAASPFSPAEITTLYPLQPSERAVIDSLLEKRAAAPPDLPSSPTSAT